MSSFNRVSPFYTTDLEAMTALVLNRSAFLDSVTDAVTYEDKKPEAAQMVAVLEKNAFLQLMPAFLSDADISIRNKAYLALGNLIASNNRTVAEAAFKCAYNALKDNKFVFTAETARGIAYILANMALRFSQWPNAKDILGVVLYADAPLLFCAKRNLTADLPSSAKKDLLWVFKKLKSSLLEPTLLMSILEREEKNTFKLALYLLGEKVSSNKFFESHCFEETYDYLSGMLLKDESPFGTTHEHLWMLSNLVTESGMGLQFLQDEDLFEAVAKRIRLGEDNAVVTESVWVICNSLAHVQLADLSSFRLFEVCDALQVFLQGDHGSPLIRDEAEIYLQNVEAEINNRYPPTTPVVEPETVYDDFTFHGVKYEVKCSPPTTPVVEPETVYDDFTFHEEDYTLRTEMQPPCVCPGFTIYNPPSAATLLQKNIIYEFTSVTVFDLIKSLESNNLQFTPIPAGTKLTVEDLAALETRGFTIIRGHIGINPALSKAMYNAV